MAKNFMTLDVLSPQNRIFSGTVSCVVLPGSKAPFTVLCNHAPIISTLTKGRLSWIAGDTEQSIIVSGGFVEVKDNVITVCVEAYE